MCSSSLRCERSGWSGKHIHYVPAVTSQNQLYSFMDKSRLLYQRPNFKSIKHYIILLFWCRFKHIYCLEGVSSKLPISSSPCIFSKRRVCSHPRAKVAAVRHWNRSSALSSKSDLFSQSYWQSFIATKSGFASTKSTNITQTKTVMTAEPCK